MHRTEVEESTCLGRYTAEPRVVHTRRPEDDSGREVVSEAWSSEFEEVNYRKFTRGISWALWRVMINGESSKLLDQSVHHLYSPAVMREPYLG